MINPLKRSDALLDQRSSGIPGKDYPDSLTSLSPSDERFTL
jgi:hypothetical protein